MSSKIVKVTFEGTIPVDQYANIKPSIEIETDDLEEAKSIAIPFLKGLFDEYSEKGARTFRDAASRKADIDAKKQAMGITKK